MSQYRAAIGRFVALAQSLKTKLGKKLKSKLSKSQKVTEGQREKVTTGPTLSTKFNKSGGSLNRWTIGRNDFDFFWKFVKPRSLLFVCYAN